MSFSLHRDKVRFLMIDVQERLLPAISGHDAVLGNAVRLLKTAQTLSIPLFYTEQYPKGIGPTHKELLEALPDGTRRFEKVHFSCCGEEGFDGFLNEVPRPVTVLFGIESHICVLSTALDLAARGERVVVAADACGSRSPENHALALSAMGRSGVLPLPTETVVYRLIGRSGTPEFKAMLPLFK